MAIDPKKIEEWRELLATGKYLGCWHCGADLMATEQTAREATGYGEAVTALLSEREELLSELERLRAHVKSADAQVERTIALGREACDVADAEREELLAELKRIRAERVPFEASPSWVEVSVAASDPEQRQRAVQSIQNGQKALAVLREIEWEGRAWIPDLSPGHRQPTEVHACLVCRRPSGAGHAPDCRLAALLTPERTSRAP